MRTTAIITTVLLSAGLVAGCGSSDSGSNGKDGGDKSRNAGGDYCTQLKAAKADFGAFQSDSPDFSKFDDAIASFHELAGNAPTEVADDWKTVDEALTSMEKALADAGLKMADIGAISAGKLPEGMSAKELQEIGPKLQTAFSGLDSDNVEKAGNAIEKHAKSTCGVDLNG